ncbi:shikimate kinase [uncultured Rothia sp.]|uniref:shikimate kinase n=1 Tax=uncultured Rothia sp. TaxID=316088 RepID=UPI0028D38C26|nr:shikimate kinase [uncultured Rothia sp.]
MPLPVEPAGVHPVASSPLARIAAAAQRARGGASPRPETGAESGVSEPGVPAAAEQSVEAAGAGVRETAASVSSVRPASRVPTPADLMRSGTRPLPAAATTASTQGVRLYASSVSEDADPALGLDEDLRLKLLSALQGMAEEEPREESAQAETSATPVPPAPKPAAPKPVAPKPTAPKQAQPAAGESATSAPAPKPAAPKPAVAKPLRPTPALFGKVQVSAAESAAEEIAAVDSAEAAAEIEARATSEAELNAELEPGKLEPLELEPGEIEESARIHPQQVREMHENFAEQSRPIVLIGPMAAGKTYIGTHLARFYGYEFLDADQLIVERYGEVSEIFEIFGEAHFRELERKTIEEVLTSPVYRNTVFSLGGGAPMTDSVAELLRDECVVYILVDAETVTPRITGNKTRPLLQPNPVERWTDIFERRRSRYEELAHFTLDARGGRPITEMTAEIQAYVTASRKARANNS